MQPHHRTNTARLLVTLMIVAVIGCGRDSPRQGTPMDGYPIINPDDPEFIDRWESSEYNYDNSKIHVVELRFLHGALGDSTAKEAKSVALEVLEAKTAGVTPEQQAAIEGLIRDEAAIHAVVRTAVYECYKEAYPDYREGWLIGAAMYGGADKIDEVLPRISSGDELDDLVRIAAIYIHPPVDGSVSLGIEFAVPWDEEHAMGLRLHEGKVEAIGSAHEAFPVPQR